MGVESKHFIVIGNPENRKVKLFQEAAFSKGASCEVFSYLDLLQNKIAIEQILKENTILRIESSGENAAVREIFIRKGQQIANLESVNLPLEFGQIGYNRLWYLAYVDFLNDLQNNLDQFKDIKVLNNPASIELMFHKLKCQEHLSKAGVPVPDNLGAIHNFEELLTVMDEKDCNRVFVKPCHNSSASGILAFRRNKSRRSNSGNIRYSLITSVELQDRRGEIKLFNSLKMRHYTEVEEIEKIVNALSNDGLYVEKWIPKAGVGDGVFDLRVLVINGEARHVVARQSQSPITNLHLGNARGDLEAIKTKIKEEDWAKILSVAEQAVQSIEGALYAGVDVLLANNWKYACVLEVNAFGDLLPRLTHRGDSTYEAIVQAAID